MYYSGMKLQTSILSFGFPHLFVIGFIVCVLVMLWTFRETDSGQMTGILESTHKYYHL